MATFKLGAIITDIAGSVGGTTLKRNGNYRVIMNKSNGTAYSRSLRNQALSYLGYIFKAWTFLSSGEKEAWSLASLSYTFPDKFGTLRNLSGRQLFIKLNAQRFKINPVLIDPADISSAIAVFDVDPIIFNDPLNIIDFQVFSDSVVDVTYIVSAELSINPLPAPTFIVRKPIASFTSSGGFIENLYPYLLSLYPFFTPQYNVRFYIQAINASGFKSVMQYRNMI